jgi:ATP-dependent Clp protease ATP-binding subunit ClpB
LTDGQGRVVNFKNTIIIMTSNIGSESIADEKDSNLIEMIVDEALKKHFRPEFLNRIDERIVFGRLSKDDIHKIVDIQIEKVGQRLKDKEIGIELTARAKDVLAQEGYDPVYGARPLKRVIQKMVQDKIALKMLKGEIKDKSHLLIDKGTNGELAMTVS